MRWIRSRLASSVLEANRALGEIWSQCNPLVAPVVKFVFCVCNQEFQYKVNTPSNCLRTHWQEQGYCHRKTLLTSPYLVGEFDFPAYTQRLYTFWVNEYCDIFIELAKATLKEASSTANPSGTRMFSRFYGSYVSSSCSNYYFKFRLSPRLYCPACAAPAVCEALVVCADAGLRLLGPGEPCVSMLDGPLPPCSRECQWWRSYLCANRQMNEKHVNNYKPCQQRFYFLFPARFSIGKSRGVFFSNSVTLVESAAYGVPLQCLRPVPNNTICVCAILRVLLETKKMLMVENQLSNKIKKSH